MKKNLSVSFLILLSQQVSFSQNFEDQGLDNTKEIQDYCSAIVEDFSKDEIAMAFEKLKGIWVLPMDELNLMSQQTIEQLTLVEDRFGDCIGYEFVKEEEVKNILYRLTYVVKYERHAIRLRFSFYNGSKDRWYLNYFNWDDSISELFND